MSASAKYGLLLAFILTAATAFAPPAVLAAVWLLLALQLFLGTAVTWRRTRLPFAAAAMATAGVALVLAAWWGGGVLELTAYSVVQLAVLAALIAAGPALLVVESRRNPAAWKAWTETVERSSLRDMLALRHIPSLRN